MESVGAYEAKTHLPQLLERVENGEEITITRHGRPVARLVPIAGADESPRVGGQWKGRVRIADDFDRLPDDIAAAFGVESP